MVRSAYAVVGEQQEVGEEVVEPTAADAEHGDLGGAEGAGRVERELEVGGVLVGRVAVDACAGGDRRARRRRASALSRSPITRSTREPERERVADAGVGRDHERRGGERRRRSVRGRPRRRSRVRACGLTRVDPHTETSDRTPCAGMTRIRFGRSGAACPTSQPGAPDSRVVVDPTADGRWPGRCAPAPEPERSGGEQLGASSAQSRRTSERSDRIRSEREAAVDGEGLAGHVGRVGREEEHDDRRDLGRGALASERHRACGRATRGRATPTGRAGCR